MCPMSLRMRRTDLRDIYATKASLGAGIVTPPLREHHCARADLLTMWSVMTNELAENYYTRPSVRCRIGSASGLHESDQSMTTEMGPEQQMEAQVPHLTSNATDKLHHRHNLTHRGAVFLAHI